jgi:hypothetical protein
MYQPTIHRHKDNPNTYKVQAASLITSRAYIVTLPQDWEQWRTLATCTCPERAIKTHICKHIIALIQRIHEKLPLKVELTTSHITNCPYTLRHLTYYRFDNAHTITAQQYLFNKPTLYAVKQGPPTTGALIAQAIAPHIQAQTPIHEKDGVLYDPTGNALAIGFNPDWHMPRDMTFVRMCKSKRVLAHTPPKGQDKYKPDPRTFSIA